MALKSLSTGKTYKNVYTILEKVKKGEIATHYGKNDSLFNRLDFYKKPDLVKPHLHYLDEYRLESIVDKYINNAIHADRKELQNYLSKFGAQAKFKALPADQQPNIDKFAEKFRENYKKFPKHLSKDIYKMFYNKIENLDFVDRTDKNQTQFKFLEKSNNPVAKIMSESSSLKSSIYARSIMLYYLMSMTALEFIDPDKHDKMMNNLNGEGDEKDNSEIDDAVEDMFEKGFNKKHLEKMMDDATKLCKDIDQNIPEDVQEKMFNEANKAGGNNDAGNISPDYIRKVVASLETLNLSMGSLKEKIKKIMDKSINYFSAKKITILEDLFSSDNLGGLDDFVLLHPSLRKIMIEDVTIKDTKSIGKINIYIDISGSMSSHCGVTNEKGAYISRMDFAKSFTAKLKSMDMLNEVFLFNTNVRPCKNDLISIAMIDCDGGTSLNAVAKHIKKEGENAIVITDAEDRMETYTEYAYIIGTNGASFRGFDRQYLEKQQCIIFDGKTVFKVNERGQAIK